MNTTTLFERDDRKEQSTSSYMSQDLIVLFCTLGFKPQKVEMDYDETRNRLDKIRFYFLESECRPIENKLLSGEEILVSFLAISKASVEWKSYLEIANSRLRNNAS